MRFLLDQVVSIARRTHPGTASITFNVAAPTDNGAYSVLENYAAGGNGVSLSSQGGNAGVGQQNEGNGNGGVGGTGGVGGNITFNLPINPNQPSALSYIAISTRCPTPVEVR